MKYIHSEGEKCHFLGQKFSNFSQF